MKYLKSFNESNTKFGLIIPDLEDIFLELEDIGFKIQIREVTNWYLYSDSRQCLRITIVKPNDYYFNILDVSETLQRVEYFLTNLGFETRFEIPKKLNKRIRSTGISQINVVKFENGRPYIQNAYETTKTEIDYKITEVRIWIS